MKKHLIVLLSFIILSACKVEKIIHNNPKSKPVVKVFANAETEPVHSSGDAADDICIWINPKDVMKSTIIGTDKKRGLEVYNLNGKRLKSYQLGRVNNVDIRYGFKLNGKEYPVVTASNRTHNTISILIVKENGNLEEIAARPIVSKLKPVYGLGMYKSKKTNKIYVFMVDKRGGVEQWELFESNGKIDAKLVREIALSGKGEGIVADDFYAKVYIGEEDKALWKFDAEPNATNNRVKIIGTNDLNMKDDFEGVTIYDKGNGKGYVILSSQGNNSYAVFDRVSNQYLGTFKIANGKIDKTSDTDGIDATPIRFNSLYPKGFFIAQDGTNKKGNKTLHQNFKIVDWREIEKKLKLN